MAWALWLLAGLMWLLLWAMIIAGCIAKKDDDAVVDTFGSLLPPFCAATCLVVFFIAHERTPIFHEITLWVHHASIFMLFLFLISAEYFQLEAWWRIRRGSNVQSVIRCFRNLWILTETMPAPIALTIFLTGLRLIWDSPELNSPSNSWLLILIIGFSFFFWDGILGYQPIVRSMLRTWNQAIENGSSPSNNAHAPHDTLGSLQLFLHFLSWPFVFLVGLYRWSPNMSLTQPLMADMSRLRFLPFGWPEVAFAILLWLIVGATVFAVRAAFGHSRRLKVQPQLRDNA